MIPIPPAFAAGIIAEHGQPGRVWLAELPGLVADLCDHWALVRDGNLRHGHLGLVVPVRRGGDPCVLKISWPDPTTTLEARALAAWAGHGMVRVLAADPARCALLLERLDPERPLSGLALDDAMTVAGDLIRRFSIPAAAGFPTVAALADDLVTGLSPRWERLGRHIPYPLIERAVDLARTSPAPSACMVNWDLHAGNVLWSPDRREWVAIDPKPAVGPPEFGVAQLLWTRLAEMAGPADLRRHLATLTETGGLDLARTIDWTRVRVVDYWLWGLGIGSTQEPRRCATLLEWLDALG